MKIIQGAKWSEKLMCKGKIWESPPPDIHWVTAQRRASAVKRNNDSCLFQVKCGTFPVLSALDATLGNISAVSGVTLAETW